MASTSPNNTPFTPNSDLVAQMTGTGNVVPGFPSAVGSGLTPTYAATIDFSTFLIWTRYIDLVTTAAVGNSTISNTVVRRKGTTIDIVFLNDASGARTITFGTGFRTTGTLVGVASQYRTIGFISDGTTFIERYRTASMA